MNFSSSTATPQSRATASTVAVPHTTSSATAHGLELRPSFDVFVGIATVAGAVIAYLAFAHQKRQARREDARSQVSQAEKTRVKEAEEAARAEIERATEDEKRRSTRWRAAAILLRDSLFFALPDSLRDGLVNRIIFRIDDGVRGDGDLFRITRLVIERWLLSPALLRGNSITAESSVHAVFDRLLPTIDHVVRGRHEAPSVMEFETSFQLDALEEHEPKASTYLRALVNAEKIYEIDHVRLEDTDRFITTIKVNDGFVAPSYHINGITRKFATNSQRALAQFNEELGQNPSRADSMQWYYFFCWLLWGASIPVCTCKRWEGAFRVLQYGYGDESKSFPLILDQDVYNDAWDRIRSELQRIPGKDLPLAIGSVLECTIVWGPRYHVQNDFFPTIFTVKATAELAHRVRTTYRRDLPRRSIFDGLMLRADSIHRMLAPRRYYSAYLWIMFEVCGEDGESLYDDPSQRWRFLFPILEEANIADGQLLMVLKRQLAEKAWKLIEEFERDSPGKRLRYLCAFDDPGSVTDQQGTHNFALAVHAPEVLDTKGNDSDAVRTIGENRLRMLLARHVPDARRFDRLFSPAPDRRKVMTSCDLPEMVAQFYRDVLNQPNP